MRRPLTILGVPSDREPAEPITVDVGGRLVSIADAHDGSAARRFASMFEDVGARVHEANAPEEPVFRIVVRSTPQSPEARLRAEVIEETADLVLGSPRQAFATLLAARAPSSSFES